MASSGANRKITPRSDHEAFIQRLRELRAQIVASGEPLLGWDDVQREALEKRLEDEASAR